MTRYDIYIDKHHIGTVKYIAGLPAKAVDRERIRIAELNLVSPEHVTLVNGGSA